MPAQTHRAEVATEGKRTLTTMDRMTLIEGLNHDLAREYRDILMHIPYPRELRAHFQAEVSDEQGDAGEANRAIAPRL